MRDTFNSTNSLKGLAICAVLINHFLNLNIHGDYLWFASLFVSLFFMVSGYGIYYSLERSGFAAKPRLKSLLQFYFNRLVRIYPLFMAAYIIQCPIFNDVMLTWTFLGIHALGHYWFMPAIIQCYLLAPFLFIVIKRHRFLSLNILVISFVAANLLLVSIVLTIMIVFKYQDSTYYLYSLFTKTICPLIILCSAAVYLIANNLQFSLLAWIGRASYAIYLFHVIMYRSINELSGFGKNSLMEFLIVIAVMPLYFYLCTIVESWNNKVTKTLRFKS